MLTVRNLDVFYGPMRAVRDISLAVPDAAVVALLGANGAGKTSTLKAIAGFAPGARGDVFLGERLLTRVPAHRRVAAGIATVPDERELFPTLSVDRNLRLGAYLRRDRAEIERDLDQVYALFPALQSRRGDPVGTLSGGQAQMVAIGRALMSRPRLLLLDEPSHGLAPVVVDEIFALLPRLSAERGMSILLVEQNAGRALQAASYGYVLETGTLALEGPTAELKDDPRVRDLYLGGS